MTNLSPIHWYLIGSAGFITASIICAVLLHRSLRPHRPIEPHTDAYWQGRGR